MPWLHRRTLATAKLLSASPARIPCQGPLRRGSPPLGCDWSRLGVVGCVGTVRGVAIYSERHGHGEGVAGTRGNGDRRGAEGISGSGGLYGGGGDTLRWPDLIVRCWVAGATRRLCSGGLWRGIAAAASSAGDRGQCGFAAGVQVRRRGMDASLGPSHANEHSGCPCSAGGRTVVRRGGSGGLRGTAVVRWRAGKVGRLADKVEGLGTCSLLGALVARPRVPRSARPERVFCRQRACPTAGLVHWGLSRRSNFV